MNIVNQIDTLQAEIDACKPSEEAILAQIREYYRIGLTYTSNALEGNSLTETETKIVLEEGITIGGKPLIDHLEAVGHSDSLSYLFDKVDSKSITQEDIQFLHELFYFRICPNQAGVYRAVKAYITGSKYPLPAPAEIEQLMLELIVKIEDWRKSKHPVEAVALAHKEFVFIHPFVDGNGRVARLLMNLMLMQAGFYTLAVIPPVVRAQYIAALEKAHLDDRDFINFIAKMVQETQRDYLRLFC